MSARGDRLAALLAERELDCLLVSDLMNVRWLTGFTGSNGACVVTRDERLFFTDFRYIGPGRRAGDRVRPGRGGARDAGGTSRRAWRGRAGFDDANVSVRAHAKLAEKTADGVELVAAGGLVERLRAIKDAGELAAMRAAAEHRRRRLRAHSRARPRPGAASARSRSIVARFIEDAGAEGPSFPPIVAAGRARRAARTPCPATSRSRRDTLVVVDMGASRRRLLLGLHAHVRAPARSRTMPWRSTSSCARPGGGSRRGARGRGLPGGRRRGPRPHRGAPATASASATASATASGSRCTRHRGSRGPRRARSRRATP